MRFRFATIVIVLFVLIGIIITETAAQNLVTCPGLVQQAIRAVGGNCNALDRNSACYGFDNVQATFSEPQPAGFFTKPSDRSPLLDLQDLITSPMDQSLSKWGIALLSAQANLPDTLPGQSVVFMLLGDTQIENAVPADQTFQTGAIASVTFQMGGDLYYLPSLDQQVVGSVPAGTSVTADAVSADGQWVRVAYAGTPGWVTRQIITSSDDLSKLPVIGPDTKTPMQAFYFRTSISGTQCSEAPNALVVQGPQHLTVDLQANGANMRIGSTIALYLLPVDMVTQQYLTQQYGNIGIVSELMQIVVLDGHVELNPGTPDEIDLTTGQTTFTCLSEPENLGDDGLPNDRSVFAACPWAPPRPVTVDDIAMFRDLQGFTLNYPIELPLTLPTVTPSPSPTATNTRAFVGGPFIPSATPLPTDTPTTVPQQPPPPPQQPSCPSIPSPVDTPAKLVAAIKAANCRPGADVITLADSSTFSFMDVDNTTDGPNALPSITSTITINGADSVLEHFGEGLFRIFHVASGGKLTLNHLTIESGYVIGDSGGAIYNLGSLTLSSVTLSDNVSSTDGGAIYNSGTLSTTNTTFEGNQAAGGGGGLYNLGTASITDTTIDRNMASAGGGIDNEGGSLTLLNSTISDNTSPDGGSQLNVGSGSATLNFATLYIDVNSGTPNLETSGTVTSKNSIVFAPEGVDACFGAISTQGVNFATDDTCSGFTQSPSLMMDDLGSNGGPTLTDALESGSSAIDAAADCTTTRGKSVTEDQRGVSRPQPSGGTCDAGAYELESGGP